MYNKYQKNLNELTGEKEMIFIYCSDDNSDNTIIQFVIHFKRKVIKYFKQ